jgi:hypothetical protein
MTRLRRLLSITVLAAAVAMIASPPSQAADARLKAPRSVKRGAVFQFTATGMAPNAKLTLLVQAEDHVGSNGGSVPLRPVGRATFTTDADGKITAKTRMARWVYICVAVDDCTPITIQPRSRVLLQVAVRDYVAGDHNFAKTWVSVR